uniref:AlNc14C194G8533 protein n=1 Tax=Albugo laibachii Nc14 TaxID=890382 RepID=F0WQ53_9STRA|nr:AlNc14C194G8533 [Albugo laibachii Nc14]|eukprot:CCA23458.1 AlNc14C194G8533 [Albugo laibachii Nc14]
METPKECDKYSVLEGNDATDSERDQSQEEEREQSDNPLENSERKPELQVSNTHIDVRFSLQKAKAHIEFLTRVLAQLKFEHQQEHLRWNSLQSKGIVDSQHTHVNPIHSEESERSFDTIERDEERNEEESPLSINIDDYIREIDILRSQSSELKKENVRLECKIEQLEAATKRYERVHEEEMTTDGSKIIHANSTLTSPTTSLSQKADCVEDCESTASVSDHPNQSDKKVQELWQTIKSLQLYVELYRTEKNELLRQRDEAMDSAERALEANVRLAGNANPHQKIKYLQSMKNENVAFQKKIRELQLRLRSRDTKLCTVCDSKAQKYINHKSRSTTSQSHESTSQASSQDEDSVKLKNERNDLFRKMWSRNKKLQAEVDHLRAKKKALSLEESSRTKGGRIAKRS